MNELDGATMEKKVIGESESVQRIERISIQDRVISHEDISKMAVDITVKGDVEFSGCVLTPDHLKCLRDEIKNADCEILNLEISFTNNINELLEMTCSIVKKYRTTSLSLEYDKLNDESIETLQKYFEVEKIASLQNLDISYNKDISAIGYKQLGRIMRESNVMSLTAKDCNITEEKLENFLDAVNSCKLRKLDISRNKILTAKSFQVLAEFVTSTGIENLNLSGCKVTKESIESFHEILTRTGQTLPIGELDMSYNSTMEPNTFLGEVVMQCGVKKLSMAGCKLNEDHLSSFRKSLNGHEMEMINMRDNFTMGKGITEVAELVKQCKLNELNICDCMFSAEEIESFRETLGVTKIRHVHLGDQEREPDADYINEICNLLPNVKDALHLRFHKLHDDLRSRLQEHCNNNSTEIFLTVGLKEEQLLDNDGGGDEVEEELPNSKESIEDQSLNSSKTNTLQAATGDHMTNFLQNEVFKNFKTITDFKMFARSKHGLSLDEHAIQTIEDDNHDSEVEKMLKIVNLWKEANGEKATAQMIRSLVKTHQIFSSTKNPDDILVLEGGLFVLDKTHWLNQKDRIHPGEHISGLGTSRNCAIKLIPYDEKNLREAEILSNLPEHENVISIKHVGIHKSTPLDYVYIAMELGWANNLRGVFKEIQQKDLAFDELHAKNLARQLFKALHFIHEENIIHGNLKPENLLISDDSTLLKITDFSVSRKITDGRATKQATENTGNEGYNAPETYEENKISQASDIFSAAIILAEMFSNGRHPLGDNPNVAKSYKKYKLELDLSHLLVSNFIPVKSLIHDMSHREPGDRLTAREVLGDDALKMMNTKALSQQEIVRHFESSRLTTLEAEITPGLKPMISRMLEKLTSPEMIKSMLQVPQIGPLVADFARRQRYSTTTGKEIILYNPRSKRFDIYKFINGSMQKIGETKEYIPECSPVFNVVELNGYLYVFHFMETSRLKYLDTEDEWSTAANPKASISFVPTAVVLNGSIYVCGGSTPLVAIQSVEKYDENEDQWNPVNPMLTGRENPCIVATDDFIYCIGGEVDRINSRTIERFDPTTENWKMLDLLLPRGITADAKATALKHWIVIVDGKQLLCCDTKKNSWSELDLSDHRSFLDSDFKEIVTVNEMVCLIGMTSPDDLKFLTASSDVLQNAKPIINEEMLPTLD